MCIRDRGITSLSISLSTSNIKKGERRMDYNKIAQDILDNVGGKANVKQVTHCFTRLRLSLIHI